MSGVIKSQILDFILRCFARSNVDKCGNIIGDDAVLVFDSGDGKILGIDFAILAPIPDFPFPIPVLLMLSHIAA